MYEKQNDKMNINNNLEWNIYTFNSIKFNYLLLIDYKSLIFIFLVRIIFSIIIIYRVRYI